MLPAPTPLRWLLLLLPLAWALPASVAAADPALDSIAVIRGLNDAAVQRNPPARIRGIVTRATPFELFVQDGPHAIFVWLPSPGFATGCHLGDEVEIAGTVSAGHLLPLIKASEIRRLAHRGLPPPRRVRYVDMAAGREDCQWAEIDGFVRTVDASDPRSLSLQLAFDGHTLTVFVADYRPADLPGLIGARLRVRGVVSGSKTARHYIVEPVLWSDATPDTFVVEATGYRDVYAAPLHAMGTLLGESHGSIPAGLLRLRGVVTAASPHQLFLRAEGKNIEVRLKQPAAVRVGDIAEAAGFPEMGSIQPVLEYAFARRLASGPPPTPVVTSADRLLDYQHEADLVEVRGELLERFPHGQGLTLVVSDGQVVFNVDLPRPSGGGELPLPRLGSRLALTGICQIDRLTPPNFQQLVAPASFHLQLRSPADLVVLAAGPWWTTDRLFTAIAALLLLGLLAVGWIWSLDRRVRAQTAIIARNAQAAAIQDERNRIAREFHDTLEQQLSGTTILLDAIASIVGEQPARARAELATARAMLRHSLDEAQQAITDLRLDDLFSRDLKTLIEHSARARLRHTTIAADFHFDPAWPDPDPVVKKHLLRIVEESVTNAVKHASPSRLAIHLLANRDRLELQVVDDGRGFDHPPPGAPQRGEFGLIGLRERAEKIGARLVISSAPGRGTTIALSLRRSTLAV